MKKTQTKITMTQAQFDAAIAAAAAQAAAQVLASMQGKVASKKPTDKVAFTKKDGTTKVVSEAQAKAWTKWQANSKSKEELQAMTDAFKWTKKATDFIKANPLCSQKELSAAGFKGCTREMLKAKKAEMRTAGIIA